MSDSENTGYEGLTKAELKEKLLELSEEIHELKTESARKPVPVERKIKRIGADNIVEVISANGFTRERNLEIIKKVL
jgi:HJR/Mrr/RecB family endonuclease